jgi:hypothetical protein
MANSFIEELHVAYQWISILSNSRGPFARASMNLSFSDEFEPIFRVVVNESGVIRSTSDQADAISWLDGMMDVVNSKTEIAGTEGS